MMQVVVISLVVVLYVQEALGGALVVDWFPGWMAAALAVGGPIGSGLTTYGFCLVCGRRADRTGSLRDLRSGEIAAQMLRIMVVFWHAVAVLLLGWVEAVRGVVGDPIVLDELAVLAPALAGLAISFACAYPIDRRLREAMLIRDLDEGRPVHAVPGMLRSIWMGVRHNVLFLLVPLLLIRAWTELAGVLSQRWWGAGPGDGTAGLLTAGLELGGALAVLALMPPVLRVLWDTVRIPESGLRDELASVCSAHRVRVTDLLVWRTDGTLVNGAVMGLLPALRYIILTDGLLERLPQRELVAVTAHEVGHVRRRHMAWLAAAVLATVLIVGTLSGWAAAVVGVLTGLGAAAEAETAGAIGDVGVGAALLVTLTSTLLVLGYVSRRFEWQADAFAVQHLSGMRAGGEPVPIREEAVIAMASALGRVAALNGFSTRRFTWRHGSIRSRQERLAKLAGEPSDGLIADRTAGRVKAWAVAALAVGVVLATIDTVLVGGAGLSVAGVGGASAVALAVVGAARTAAGLSATERRVRDEIASRQDDLLEDLRRHVARPTGGGNAAALDETRGLLGDRLAALGARVELVPGDPPPPWLYPADAEAADPGRVPPTAVCHRLRGADTRPRILIAGHLDTVHDPAGPFRQLSVRPGAATATGPGCVDMKGGLVIAVAALEALEACGVAASWTVLLNSDEETGSYSSERALRDQSARHDVGLALEPALAGGELAIERLGSGQFMIECRGRAAHVGREFEKGVSAVTALAERLVEVARAPAPDRGRIVSVGPIEGGVATNAVPDRARAWGNVRFPTRDVADELAAMLDALATPEDAVPACRVERSFNRPAKPVTPEVRRLAELAQAVAADLGQALPFAKTGGVCDGNIMQDAGLPTIDTLGVRGGGLHTPDEWIELPSLLERCQLLALVMARLSAGGNNAL